MTRRIITTGNARPHIERTGYLDRSRFNAPLRPMVQPGFWQRLLGRK